MVGRTASRERYKAELLRKDWTCTAVMMKTSLKNASFVSICIHFS